MILGQLIYWDKIFISNYLVKGPDEENFYESLLKNSTILLVDGGTPFFRKMKYFPVGCPT